MSMKPGDLFRVKSRFSGPDIVALGLHDPDAEEDQWITIGTIGLIVGPHDIAGADGADSQESYAVIVEGLTGWLFASEIEVISEAR